VKHHCTNKLVTEEQRWCALALQPWQQDYSTQTFAHKCFLVELLGTGRKGRPRKKKLVELVVEKSVKSKNKKRPKKVLVSSFHNAFPFISFPDCSFSYQSRLAFAPGAG
jgi:hypothetical protein